MIHHSHMEVMDRSPEFVRKTLLFLFLFNFKLKTVQGKTTKLGYKRQYLNSDTRQDPLPHIKQSSDEFL